MVSPKDSRRLGAEHTGVLGRKRWRAFQWKRRCWCLRLQRTSQRQRHREERMCPSAARGLRRTPASPPSAPAPQDDSLSKLPEWWRRLFIWHKHRTCFHDCNTNPKPAGLPFSGVTTSSCYEFCVSLGPIFIAFVFFCTARSGKLGK